MTEATTTLTRAMLAHGGADAIVPVREAHELFANRPDEHVKLLFMLGNHDQYKEIERYIVIGFLNTTMFPDQTGLPI